MKNETFSDRALQLLENALIDAEEAVACGKCPVEHFQNAHNCLQLAKTVGQRRDR